LFTEALKSHKLKQLTGEGDSMRPDGIGSGGRDR